MHNLCVRCIQLIQQTGGQLYANKALECGELELRDRSLLECPAISTNPGMLQHVSELIPANQPARSG